MNTCFYFFESFFFFLLVRPNVCVENTLTLHLNMLEQCLQCFHVSPATTNELFVFIVISRNNAVIYPAVFPRGTPLSPVLRVDISRYKSVFSSCAASNIVKIVLLQEPTRRIRISNNSAPTTGRWRTIWGLKTIWKEPTWNVERLFFRTSALKKKSGVGSRTEEAYVRFSISQPRKEKSSDYSLVWFARKKALNGIWIFLRNHVIFFLPSKTSTKLPEGAMARELRAPRSDGRTCFLVTLLS